MTEESIFYSQHIFIFPFSWEINSRSENSKYDLKQIDLYISETNLWEKYQFKNQIIDGYNSYNTNQYFYEFSKDVLNLNQLDENDILANQYQVIKKYKNPTYQINILNGITLDLDIQDIMISFYENGIGIMAYHLINKQNKNFDHILKINEYGRRIYPQFLGIKDQNLTEDTKYNFLANYIKLLNVKIEPIEENFTSYNNSPTLFHQPNHIFKLIGHHFVGGEPSFNQCMIKPVLDDRMFIMCHVIDDELSKELSIYNKSEKSYAYCNGGEVASKWYRFIFVDDSKPTCKSINMREDLLNDHSYDRWLNKDDIKGSQLYGISRYSFVLITGTDSFNRDIIGKHFCNQYFDLVLLCLIQRAYLLQFGRMVSHISKELRLASSDKVFAKISAIYLNYIKFTNRIYFREVTPQEQGIELYDKLQNKMRIKDDVESLGDEIRELNEYIQTSKQGKLAEIANIFLPATLLASVLGMNTIGLTEQGSYTLKDYIILTISCICIAWSIWIIIRNLIKQL